MAELKFTYDPKIDKPTAMQVVMNSVDSLIQQGLIEGPLEQAVLDIVFTEPDTVTAVIDDNRMLDQLRSQDYIDSVKFEDLLEDTVKTYSVRTIRERLKLSELPLKKQIRYFILDYRRYYKMQMKDFIENPDEFYRLKAQFVTDFMGYMNLVMSAAANGENLAKLLGLTALVPRAAAAGRKLGVDYKQINKVGGAPRALLERTQLHFKEFIDAITDVVFKNWRSKIAGQEELPEQTDADLIEDEEINEEVPEMTDANFSVTSTKVPSTESKNYSDELNGEVSDGETMEFTPAEEEELRRESEFNGDGRRLYSDKFKSINDSELNSASIGNAPIIDVDALRSQGYTKWIPITDLDDEELRKYLSNGAIIMAGLLFKKDDPKIDLGDKIDMKKFSTDDKLQWGYTKDLINQRYNEGMLTTKYLQKLHDKGLNRFYMFDDEREADEYADKVLNKANELNLDDMYELDDVQDPELGKVWVLFTCTKVAKFFSNTMKRFNK